MLLKIFNGVLKGIEKLWKMVFENVWEPCMMMIAREKRFLWALEFVFDISSCIQNIQRK